MNAILENKAIRLQDENAAYGMDPLKVKTHIRITSDGRIAVCNNWSHDRFITEDEAVILSNRYSVYVYDWIN